MNDKLLYIDADTLIVASAAKEEQNRCLAKHLPTGREKLFESKTEFNAWLKENPKWKKEDFEFSNIKDLKPDYQEVEVEVWDEFGLQIHTEHRPVRRIANACHSFKQKVNAIIDAVPHKDFFVCIQGEGNFRKTIDAKYVQYKAQRSEKPLLFQELYDWVKVKYKHRCIVIDGEETDDFVCRKANEGHVVAFCDKDIPANCIGHLFNYNKPEEGVFFNTDESRWNKYWTQVLVGDSIDNIDGILKLADQTKLDYNIKTKGVGAATAEKILKGCASEKEAAERVLEAYLLAYPKDGFERMQEMCLFLHMRRYEDEVFDLASYLDKLCVEY